MAAGRRALAAIGCDVVWDVGDVGGVGGIDVDVRVCWLYLV